MMDEKVGMTAIVMGNMYNAQYQQHETGHAIETCKPMGEVAAR
jgi:hypothetical protein